jgi:low affinity Fe/Cu permease
MKLIDKLESAAGSTGGILVFIAWCSIAPVVNVDVANYGLSVYTAGLLVFTLASSRRDRKAIHAKLDDLECAVDSARSENARLEERTEEEIEQARSGG